MSKCIRSQVSGSKIDYGADIFCYTKYSLTKPFSTCVGRTSHLIGAVTIDISLEDTVRSLRSSRLYNGTSDIVIVRYEDAVIFADTLGLSTERSPVYETDFISKENFLSLNRSFDFKVPQFTHEEVVQAFQGNAILSEQGVYTAFPLPLPPSNASDVYYRPTFLVLHRAPHHVLFGAVEEMDQEIAEDYRKVAILVISLGVGGIVVVFAIVWFVSRVITEPLRWIEIVAWNIVNHRDKNADDKLNVEQQEEEKASCRFTPNTEIKELITEFHLMLNGFSGRSASSLAYPPPIEIPNEMTWRSDFRDLYTARSPKDRGLRKAVDVTDYDVEPVVEIAGAPERRLEVPDPNPGAAMIASIVPAPLKQNFGRNANVDSQLIHRKSILQDEFDVKKIVSCRTSLFWWILVLMAIPLAFTNVNIAVNVSIKVVSAVPAWISIVEEASLELERGALNSSAYLMARTAESMSQEVVRDLHLMTRLAGWLIFGAVERSDALADMDEAAEDCKLYPRDASCPFFSSGRTSCACEWEDPQVDNCVVFDKHANTRAMQRRFWHIPASDAIKNTGNRVISSFPEVDFMPNTTLWWNTTNDLPGSYRGSNASGFRTAYDRIKVTSAMSVVDLPIYNYGRSLRRKKHDLGSFLGFDADGGMTGYDGCVYGHAYVSHWSSNEQNRAFEIAPELCPKGKPSIHAAAATLTSIDDCSND